MILSCSRRTDIPAFYSEWFINRLRNKTVCVVNPFNSNQVSRINLAKEVVDCIVFWTKNPKPMLPYLDVLDQLGHKYYFQFTLTPYHMDIETALPNKTEILETFILLSERIGKEKVILRYDPIILTKKYTVAYHLKAFSKLCDKLGQHTEKVVISFVDPYRKNQSNLKRAGIEPVDMPTMLLIAEQFKAIASVHNLQLETCAESIELAHLGISHAKCIDRDLIERIVGYPLNNKEKMDANREHCGCMQSIDIGQYDTCLHNCLYCYANVSHAKVLSHYKLHNPLSEILIGEVDESKVTTRKNVK